MASLQSRLNDLITTIKAKTKSIQTMIGGTSNSDVSGLNTTATHLVGAINEVKATADAAAAAAGASINDSAASGSTTYSSNKINSEIAAAASGAVTTAVAQAKSDILGGAGPTVDTLMEIATIMAANESSDAALAIVVGNKANSSDVYTKTELGNPDTDLVAIWNAA